MSKVMIFHTEPHESFLAHLSLLFTLYLESICIGGSEFYTVGVENRSLAYRSWLCVYWGRIYVHICEHISGEMPKCFVLEVAFT